MRDPKWLELDQRWQERHPRRKCRIRRPHPDELAPMEGVVTGGASVTRPDGTVDQVAGLKARAEIAAEMPDYARRPRRPGWEPAVLVVSVAPGERLRVFTEAPTKLLDAPEVGRVVRQYLDQMADDYVSRITGRQPDFGVFAPSKPSPRS